VSVTILGLGLVSPDAGDGFRVRNLPPSDEPRLKRLPRLERMALAAARQALPPDLETRDLAVVFGTGYGGLSATRDFLEGIATRGAEFGSPIAFQQSVHHSPAGEISLFLGAHGPALTTSARELSGESALQVAVTLLDGGRAKHVLVVAADEWTPVLEAGYRAFGSLAVDGVAPIQRAFRLGEGAAAVLLGAGPGSLRLECTLTAHARPVLQFATVDQLRPLLLRGATTRDTSVSVSLAAPNEAVLESELAVLANLAPTPVHWVDSKTFGFHASSGLLRVVAAAKRIRAEAVGSTCAVHGLALGGGQSLTLVRHVGA
jgi:Beta-ketoacyl synthase, N-terminal domain